jgi:purine catabolism regulator
VIVREVLELDVLTRAGLRVITGSDLERPVRWAHSGEIADIAQYLSGGELLLTAATGLARPGQDRRRYIRELAEVGVAAVIIELGRTFTSVPFEMIEEAREHDLVLAELEREVPFVAVTQAVHTLIVEAQHAMIAAAVDTGDVIGQMVLDGAGLTTMLDVLAERLGNPVVLEDAARHVVAVGRASRSVNSLLENWQAHSREGHRREDSAHVQRAESTPNCVWTSIVLNCEVWGRLHVLEIDAPLAEATSLALGRAAASIGLHLHGERDAARLAQAAERALIQDLASGHEFSGKAFLARAAGLGVELDGPLVVFVAGDAEPADRAETEEQALALREVLRALGWPALVSALDDRVVATASAHPRSGLARAAEELLARLRATGRFRSLGVSRPYKAQCLPQALNEADIAYRLGPLQGQAGVHHYERLVLYRLLAPLLHGPELATFVEDEIGVLVAFDVRHKAELIKTLDAYLRCNGSKTDAAQALHMARRSVYHRLERIESLLGRPIDSAEERTRLYLALRARELLEARRPAVRSAQPSSGRVSSSGASTASSRSRVSHPFSSTRS